jgi:hypothetical protein
VTCALFGSAYGEHWYCPWQTTKKLEKPKNRPVGVMSLKRRIGELAKVKPDGCIFRKAIVFAIRLFACSPEAFAGSGSGWRHWFRQSLVSNHLPAGGDPN